MRIALVAMHFAEYTYRLAQALAQDHDVLLVLETINARNELGQYPFANCSGHLRVETITHKGSLVAMVRNAKHLVKAVRAFSPEVIHFQDASLDFIVWAARSLRRYPRALTIHDPIAHSGERIRSIATLRPAVNRWLLRRNCLVAISHGAVLVADIERATPRLRGRVYSVPHGPLGQGPASDNHEAGGLLFFGRIQKYKGLQYFVEAVKQLHAEGLAVKGIIAGRGEALVPLREEILTHPAFELHERFIPESEVPELFSRAALVVLPYTDGTQSGIAAMALGYGRAVVASRVGSVPEMVRDGVNGRLVPPMDVVALTDCLRDLLTHPEAIVEMGRAARRLGETELSWARNTEISVEAYRHAIELHRR